MLSSRCRKNAPKALSPFDTPRGEISFDGATFRYDVDSEPVIDNIRLTLEAKGL